MHVVGTEPRALCVLYTGLYLYVWEAVKYLFCSRFARIWIFFLGLVSAILTWEPLCGLSETPEAPCNFRLNFDVSTYWFLRAYSFMWGLLVCSKVSKTFRIHWGYFRLFRLFIVTLTRVQRILYNLSILSTCSLWLWYLVWLSTGSILS